MTKRYSLIVRLGENEKATVLKYNSKDVAIAQANVIADSFGIDADIALYARNAKNDKLDNLVGEYVGQPQGFQTVLEILDA